MRSTSTHVLTAAALLAALAAFSCDDDSPTQPGAVEFRSLLESGDSGIHERRDEAIRDANRFRQVWSEIAHAGPPPPIDFGRESVAVSTLVGTSGCFRVEIRDVAAAGDGVRVRVVEKEPGPSCICTAHISTPIHVVAFTRVAGGVFFHRERETIACG